MICDYYETVHTRPVRSEVEPGYLRPLLPDAAPQEGESFDDILSDVESKIMPGALCPCLSVLGGGRPAAPALLASSACLQAARLSGHTAVELDDPGSCRRQASRTGSRPASLRTSPQTPARPASWERCSAVRAQPRTLCAPALCCMC